MIDMVFMLEELQLYQLPIQEQLVQVVEDTAFGLVRQETLQLITLVILP